MLGAPLCDLHAASQTIDRSLCQAEALTKRHDADRARKIEAARHAVNAALRDAWAVLVEAASAEERKAS